MQISGVSLTIILGSSSVLYELIGPACAKMPPFFLSGTIKREVIKSVEDYPACSRSETE